MNGRGKGTDLPEEQIGWQLQLSSHFRQCNSQKSSADTGDEGSSGEGPDDRHRSPHGQFLILIAIYLLVQLSPKLSTRRPVGHLILGNGGPVAMSVDRRERFEADC